MYRKHQGFLPLYSAFVIALLILVGWSILYYLAKKPLPEIYTNTEGVPPPATTTPPTIQTPPQALTTLSFSAPHPIVWRVKDVELSIQAVSVGKVIVKDLMPLLPIRYQPMQYQQQYIQQYLRKPSGDYYGLDETISVALFDVKAKNVGESYACPPMTFRRVVNEEGDFAAPALSQFWFSNNGCNLQPLSTETSKIVFAIPESEKELTFTTGSGANIYFMILIGNDGKLKLEKIGPQPTPVTAQTAVSNNQPLSINWVSPAKAISIKRGDTLTLEWSASGGSANSNIDFRLNSKDHSQTFYFQASSKKGSKQVTVPPGKYTLKLGYPITSAKEISVEVSGDAQKVSVDESTLYFENENARIVADGVCGENVTVEIMDDFRYAIIGKKVDLVSDRSGFDTIIPKSSAINKFGQIIFLVNSKSVGTSKLKAVVDGIELSEYLLLQVLDPKTNECPAYNYVDGV